MLDPDMRAIIEATHLCFVATVTPEGRPNLSPKGTIRVWATRIFSSSTSLLLVHAPISPTRRGWSST
jgi:hypothetical protein